VLAEVVFVKLGGSLITQKRVEATARPSIIRRLASEIRSATELRPDIRLLLGHGSGSFGHMPAQRYSVQSGCTNWRGYAETSAAAGRLNRIVTDALQDAGVPAVSLQPSASARCRAGELVSMAIRPIEELLGHGLVPLVYGDVALDETWGSTIISTEVVFSYLARHLRPQRLLLVGEVEGVYSADPRLDQQARLIPRIDASYIEATETSLGDSHAVDVTGGMRSKVRLMLQLVRILPTLQVQVLSGLEPRLLERALCDPNLHTGTMIVA